MEEIWKDVVGYEGLYQVSNLGRVKSLPRLTKNGFNYTTRFLAQDKSRRYLSVILCKNKIEKHHCVHRLVAQAFIPNPENKPCINHIDGDKTDNRVENLEWCSFSENTQHAIRTGLISHESLVERSKLGAKKLAKPIIQLKDGIEIARFENCYDAQRKTGVPQTNINKVLRGKHKTTYGYEWKYQ